MKLEFEVENKQHCIELQNMFFKLGYHWPMDVGYPKHTDANWLYFDDINKNITWMPDHPSSSGTPIRCKMLHPKQREFLESYDNSDIISRILEDGFYKVKHSNYLNEVRKIRIDEMDRT